MYDFYDDYFESDEFEEKIEELKESLRESVKDEIKEELERLRKENQELKEVRDNWEEIKEKYRNKERELQRKMLTVEQEAKKARLNELFEASGMCMVLYRTDHKYVREPKCDKCDESRIIHFKSPSGRSLSEICECNKTFVKHIPREYSLVKFSVNKSSFGDKRPLRMYFVPSNTGNEFSCYDSKVEYIYNGEPFEEITINETSLFFKTEEECQAYCNYLNKKNGITEEMI